MNWRPIAAVASGIVAGNAHAHAHAQSSITLYGVADAGIEYANHQPGGHDVVRLTSGNLPSSRWGVRGAEDLGQRLRAVFTLESGFDIDTGKSGQAGRLFGRRAYVGLQGQWGTLTMGRHTNAIYDLSVAFDPMTLTVRRLLLGLRGNRKRSTALLSFAGLRSF